MPKLPSDELAKLAAHLDPDALKLSDEALKAVKNADEAIEASKGHVDEAAEVGKGMNDLWDWVTTTWNKATGKEPSASQAESTLSPDEVQAAFAPKLPDRPPGASPELEEALRLLQQGQSGAGEEVFLISQWLDQVRRNPTLAEALSPVLAEHRIGGADAGARWAEGMLSERQLAIIEREMAKDPLLESIHMSRSRFEAMARKKLGPDASAAELDAAVEAIIAPMVAGRPFPDSMAGEAISFALGARPGMPLYADALNAMKEAWRVNPQPSSVRAAIEELRLMESPEGLRLLPRQVPEAPQDGQLLAELLGQTPKSEPT